MEYFAEFLCTAILVLLGNGICASVNLKRMFANHPGNKWLAITLGWGLAVFIAITCSKGIGGKGHINPAFTLSEFSEWVKFFSYIPLQIAGAMFGQVILDILTWNHIKSTDYSLVRSMHCTAPAFANYGQDRALKQNFLYEFVGTCVLIGAIWGDKEGKIVGFPALVVVAIGLSLGSSTGYAINPARDLGPRIVWLFTEKLLSRCSVSRDEPSSSAQLKVGCDWSYAWVPVIAPVFAGVVMGCFKLIS